MDVPPQVDVDAHPPAMAAVDGQRVVTARGNQGDVRTPGMELGAGAHAVPSDGLPYPVPPLVGAEVDALVPPVR